jgi:hypothetical protein
MKKWLLVTSATLVSFNIFMQCALYLVEISEGRVSAMMGWFCALVWIGITEREVKQC